MKDHRDAIQRLSIELDDNAQNFGVYAARFENRFKAQPVQKFAGYDKRMWAYDLDGEARKSMKGGG